MKLACTLGIAMSAYGQSLVEQQTPLDVRAELVWIAGLSAVSVPDAGDDYRAHVILLTLAEEATAERVNPTFTYELKRIIDAHASAYGGTLALEAMNVLYLLGEPKEYFVALMKECHDRKYVAANVAWILGRETDGKVEEAFEFVEKAHKGESARDDINMFRGAVTIARGIRKLKDAYESKPKVQDRAALLIPNCASGYRPEVGWSIDVRELWGPQAAWARGELRELGEQYSGIVCECLRRASWESFGGFKGVLDRKRTEGEEAEKTLEAIRSAVASSFGLIARREWEQSGGKVSERKWPLTLPHR